MKAPSLLMAMTIACWLCSPCSSGAVSDSFETAGTPPEAEEGSSIEKELLDGFSWSLRVLGFGIIRDPVESPLTFGTIDPRQLGLPPTALLPLVTNQEAREDRIPTNTYQLESDFRPDFALSFRSMDLSVKPRLQLKWKKWDEGPKSGETETDTDLFVNEWLARYRFRESLFLSYGRENLQWGPSFLISPSNPFIRDNGRNNPKIEVGGADFGRIVWIPSMEWTASAIANTDEGEQEPFDAFQEGYALKLDYTGQGKFFSLIPQYVESEDFWMGFFGGWNATDALILHSEGRLNDEDYEILVGGSYTLQSGEMFIAEYYHNSRGTTEDPIYLGFPPFGDTDPDDQLFRKNYLLLQFVDTHIRDVFNVTLRWIGNLDDGSTRSIAILEYEWGRHVKLFTIGAYDSGDSGDEFGAAVKYSVFSGIEYVF